MTVETRGVGRRSHQVVASHDDVFSPPQDAAGHDEVLLLSLVSK